VLAAFVALLGVFLTLRQQAQERRRDKETLDQQREKDREERERQSVRRFDEQFTQFPRKDGTDRLIARAFAQGLQDHPDLLESLFGKSGLDLYRAELPRVDLSGLDLAQCEMVQANMQASI